PEDFCGVSGNGQTEGDDHRDESADRHELRESKVDQIQRDQCGEAAENFDEDRYNPSQQSVVTVQRKSREESEWDAYYESDRCHSKAFPQAGKQGCKRIEDVTHFCVTAFIARLSIHRARKPIGTVRMR